MQGVARLRRRAVPREVERDLSKQGSGDIFSRKIFFLWPVQGFGRLGKRFCDRRRPG
ncbi:hypothetical protein MPNT_20201 [Candidatus Methylacidithermus pantelleriae]|uniref:Uncharacterized protein n=1 Tax=Candidatus Methylacidithermus pantelleriae TaxID=2744239 RepID=A0A8J2FSI4_9BACT|nr:hypothetical protein MPNT_20201 [Candidatus Methylacidithermus pantelleriae]